MQPIKYAKKVDFQATMDYKNQQISKFNDEKQESMRIFSSGRDAVILVSTQYQDLTEEQIREKVLFWRKWLYCEIYGKNENFYQENNKPF